MKQLCLAMGLLAYFSNANTFSSLQLVAIESKNESAIILKFTQ